MRKKRRIIVLSSIIISILAIFIGCTIYVNDYYRYTPDNEASSYNYEELKDDTIVFEASNSTVGFIFYPGGKVEYTAYIPLMKKLSDNGITCLLVDMPFNLAVLDINRAKGLQELYPNITNWYIGGHSLGGSMAASYLSNNLDSFDGLILLGSYSTVDFSNSDIKVLSIYGSNDLVMNREKYIEYKNNIDDNLKEVVIDGGNHAYYGMYGNQKGDGVSSITNREQINITANYIIDFTK
jgi:hypothetical protein